MVPLKWGSKNCIFCWMWFRWITGKGPTFWTLLISLKTRKTGPKEFFIEDSGLYHIYVVFANILMCWMQILKVVYSKTLYTSHPWYIFGLSIMKTCNRNETVLTINEGVKTAAVLSSVKCLLTRILGSQNPWIWCFWVLVRGWKTMALPTHVLEDQSPGVKSPGKVWLSPQFSYPARFCNTPFSLNLFCLVSETLFYV